MHARREAQLDWPLLGSGFATFLAGYLASLVTAFAAFGSRGIDAGANDAAGRYDTTCHDATGGVFLIPVVGAIAGPIVHGTCSVPLYRNHIGVSFRTRQSVGASDEPGYPLMGAFAGALQIAGGSMALVALLVPASVVVFDVPASARFSLVPRGSPTFFGLELEVVGL